MTASQAGFADDLMLRVLAPKVPRGLFSRERLLWDADLLRDRAIVLVQAPAGFGKTSLLAQWRLEYLARGTVVAWFLAQDRDDSRNLLRGLVLSIRASSGRQAFGHTLLEASAPSGLEAATMWLAELAQSAFETVLMIDEADRLPDESRQLLAYVMRNSPPNLRVVVAARTGPQLGVEDLVDFGQCLAIGPTLLRFQLDETMQMIRSRGGSEVDNDAIARVHDLTEGWPLGVQMALSVMEASKDIRGTLAAMANQSGELSERLVALLLSNLDHADLEFLSLTAHLDYLQAGLCTAVTQDKIAPERLSRLARTTPVVVTSEKGEWVRVHALAREVLRGRFAALSGTQREALHLRAADWLAHHGSLEAAAGHALAAGKHTRAYDLAERSLYEAVSGRGRHDEVLRWLDLLPPGELDRRKRLMLAAAWSLALSERHEQAGDLVTRLLGQPDADDGLRCECALILGGAAVYADDPDRFAALHDPWSVSPPLQDPILREAHANRSGLRALLTGDPGMARRLIQQGRRREPGLGESVIHRWGDVLIAQSYVWEGQAMLVQQLLQPTLAELEGRVGRRAPLSCMVAALLAAAVWEQNRPAEAIALLADRLDVLERVGLPETLLLAYRTLARIAVAEGAEPRALQLLAELRAVAAARDLHRLGIVGLSEEVRLHAKRYRAESCAELALRIDAEIAAHAASHGSLWERQVEVLRHVAHAQAAIAAREWRRAVEPLRHAEVGATALSLGRVGIEIKGLRAWVLSQCGEHTAALMLEAADLARASGLLRLFADAHPDLGQWHDEVLAGRNVPSTSLPAPRASAPATGAAPVRVLPSMALTPKEREVLVLLARGLTNKEIALALQASELTIKWHLRNLFAKTNAGSRRHVVSRARILGLLDPE